MHGLRNRRLTAPATGKCSRLRQTEAVPSGGRRHLAGMLPLLATLLCDGCTMAGPDFTVPEAETSEQWTDGKTSGIGQQHTDYSQRWTVFND